MILIDKEKFIEEVRKRKYSAAIIKLIEEQPAVKAIPLSWIIDWQISQKHKTKDREKVFVWEMLEDWGKENETN